MEESKTNLFTVIEDSRKIEDSWTEEWKPCTNMDKLEGFTLPVQSMRRECKITQNNSGRREKWHHLFAPKPKKSKCQKKISILTSKLKPFEIWLLFMSSSVSEHSPKLLGESLGSCQFITVYARYPLYTECQLNWVWDPMGKTSLGTCYIILVRVQQGIHLY